MAESKYDESFPERAGEYAANGLNNREIAARLGISSDSFYVYLRKFPAFAGAVETGRLAVADKTAGSLMDLAMGNCFVTTVKCGDNGHETKTVRRRAPDLNVVIRWLERNRQYADDAEDIADVEIADSVNMEIAANAKFDERFPEQAEIHAGNGDTDFRIAGRLGISLSSFYNYKRQFPAFAAALERGRRECYGRMRGQLLAIALGNCTVTTESYRDGVFRRTTERQLPPNLKAIKYLLAADGCPSGNAGRMGKSVSAQGPSKVSESSDGCPSGNAGRMGKTVSAQGLSKVSESGAASSHSGKAADLRFAKMSRKERQRLLKHRR